MTYELGPVNGGVDTVVSTTRGVSEELRLVAGAFDSIGVSGTLLGLGLGYLLCKWALDVGIKLDPKAIPAGLRYWSL